jgi:ADP-heptose:LPS heptosyltransferase
MKILLLRFSSIGDIVLTSPVVRCLRQQIGAEVHFLTKSAFRDVVQPNPYIQKVYTFEKDVAAILPELQRERYDWVIDLHHNLRSFRVKQALGRPSRSFQKLNIAKWLLVHTGWDFLPDRHIVHRYMATVQHLGVGYDNQGLDYFIPEGTSCTLPASPFTAFAIGATHGTKRLPVEKIIAICQQSVTPVVLLGGKAEIPAGTAIASACGPKVHDYCGQLSLHQSAFVLRHAEKVLTHDTGMMHIAAALRKKIISFWGSTVPKFGMYPFYPEGLDLNTTVEVTGLSCRPCSKIGYDACPRGHFRCMEIEVERLQI